MIFVILHRDDCNLLDYEIFHLGEMLSNRFHLHPIFGFLLLHELVTLVGEDNTTFSPIIFLHKHIKDGDITLIHVLFFFLNAFLFGFLGQLQELFFRVGFGFEASRVTISKHFLHIELIIIDFLLLKSDIPPNVHLT